MVQKKHHKKKLPGVYVHLPRKISIGLLMIAAMLCLGMWGYHFFERMSWVDSFINASMILSGMGPVSPLVTNAGKIFAGCYALISGLAFIVIVAIVFSPIIHQFFRRIHVEGRDDSD